MAAPSSLPLDDIIIEINLSGFVIKEVYNVAYFFSGKVIYFLEKKA